MDGRADGKPAVLKRRVRAQSLKEDGENDSELEGIGEKSVKGAAEEAGVG
jgi:hypothetical protein